MATPNINTATAITGKTSGTALTSTNATAVLTNANSSNLLLKVNSVYVANVDGTNACDITLRYFAAASGGTGFALASTVSVPADATVVIVSKEAPIYLPENSRLEATAGTASDLEVVVSYEEIS